MELTFYRQRENRATNSCKICHDLGLSPLEKDKTGERWRMAFQIGVREDGQL